MRARERAKEARNILFFRPSWARYPAVGYRGFPSLPSAARFTPGYLSFARFAAQESGMKPNDELRMTNYELKNTQRFLIQEGMNREGTTTHLT